MTTTTQFVFDGGECEGGIEAAEVIGSAAHLVVVLVAHGEEVRVLDEVRLLAAQHSGGGLSHRRRAA